MFCGLIRSSSFPGWDGTSLEISGAGRCGNRRLAMVRGSAQFRIATSGVDVLGLRGDRADVTLLPPLLLLW